MVIAKFFSSTLAILRYSVGRNESEALRLMGAGANTADSRILSQCQRASRYESPSSAPWEEHMKDVLYSKIESSPFTTSQVDRAVEFHECQIDCCDEINEIPLLNHACANYAVARLTKRSVSGRFRLSVVAQKNIRAQRPQLGTT